MDCWLLKFASSHPLFSHSGNIDWNYINTHCKKNISSTLRAILYTFLNSFVIKWFITNRRGGSALKLEWSLHRKKRECVPFPRIASNQNLFLNQKELFSYQNCRLLKAGCLNKNKSTRHTYHIFLSALSLKWFIIKSVHNILKLLSTDISPE